MYGKRKAKVQAPCLVKSKIGIRTGVQLGGGLRAEVKLCS